MKILLIVGLLCINNFSSPSKPVKDSCGAKEETKSSYKLAPSILIVATY